MIEVEIARVWKYFKITYKRNWNVKEKNKDDIRFYLKMWKNEMYINRVEENWRNILVCEFNLENFEHARFSISLSLLSDDI